MFYISLVEWISKHEGAFLRICRNLQTVEGDKSKLESRHDTIENVPLVNAEEDIDKIIDDDDDDQVSYPIYKW
jgi:hypothetical protein